MRLLRKRWARSRLAWRGVDASAPESNGGDVGASPRLSLALEEARWRYVLVLEALGRADIKASILVTVQAALGAVLTVNAQVRISPPNRVLFLVGLVALILGIVCAGASVFPRFRVLYSGRQQEGAVHFSDLRKWEPERLAEHLAKETDDQRLEVLAWHLVRASRIVWAKNAWITRSITSAAVSILLFAIAYAI
jgi:hypothetical protein